MVTSLGDRHQSLAALILVTQRLRRSSLARAVPLPLLVSCFTAFTAAMAGLVSLDAGMYSALTNRVILHIDMDAFYAGCPSLSLLFVMHHLEN